MTPDVVAVLVVPVPGDPGGLLATGPCGGGPGFVSNWGKLSHLDSGPREWHVTLSAWGGGSVALPLWWDGALVPEGWDRARRAIGGRTTGLHRHEQMLCGKSMPNASEVFRVGCAAVFVGLASRVVRLTRVDGRLVELEPAEVGT